MENNLSATQIFIPLSFFFYFSYFLFFCRPKKRRAKKRYSTLDFSDDKSYFQKACTQEIWYPKSKRNYNYSRKRKKTENNEPPKKKMPSYLSFTGIDEKPSKKCNPLLNEMGLFQIKEEVDASSSTFGLPVKTEPWDDQPKSTSVWKIRIKSAYELGSNIVFVDISNGSATSSKPTTYQPVLSDLITGEAEPKLTENANFMTKFNIPVISSLYREFFTNDNRIIIKKVAEVLLNLSENIKKKNDKLTEINCSRSTDAEKLMLRHQAHAEFNRVRDANQVVLKQQFEAIGESFDHENFEILFQLFFLGILKTFIVSVSNKKGTLFKKIVSLLSQSLSCCEYKNDRILNLLKSKDFRADCLALVHFLEKYSETKSFDMLVISDADKKTLSSAKSSGDPADVSASSSKPSLLSTNTQVPSIVKYSKGMKILPVGSNLLLQSFSSSSAIQSKVDPVSNLNKKSTITPVSLNSRKAVKFTPVNQIAPKLSSMKKSVPPPTYNSVTSLPLSVPYHQISITKSTAPSSVGPPLYSVGSSTGPVSFSAINVTSHNTPSSSASFQSTSCLTNSNSSSLSGGGFTHFSSCVQPMCTYPASITSTNSSSMTQPSATFMYSSSNARPIRNLTNSSSSIQSTTQLTSPVSNTAVTNSSYPYLQPVVSANYSTNAVLTTSNSSNRPHSMIVTAGHSLLGASQVIGPLPSYTVTSVGTTARGVMQLSPPLPQLLPPVVPPLQPEPDTISACGMMQTSSPSLQLLSPAVNNVLVPIPVDSAPTRGIMQSSPPLQELLPPVVPNLQTQPISHSLQNTLTIDGPSQSCNEMNLSTTDLSNQSEFTSRAYGSAREVSKKVQIPSLLDQNGLVFKFSQPKSADNPTSGASMTSTELQHHFMAPVSRANSNSPVNGPFSPYRTISPAGNSENIQPHSPLGQLHQSIGESGSRSSKDVNYSICPTTSSNDGPTLRTLLMVDNGRAPLVNQNGPIEAPFQYAEKSNFSLDLPALP